MKLTAAQIQELFVFTEKKLVRYYDLQVELVDHLALRIEEEMSANNKLNFEQALEKVYAAFGIFGFAKVVQEKEQQFIKMGRRLLIKQLITFFRWPQIISVACIVTVTWQLTLWINMDILFPAFFISWITGSIILVLAISRSIKKQRKKLLSVQFSPAAINGSFFSFEWVYFTININHHAWFFCVIVTMTYLLKVATYRVFQNIRKEAVILYPEAFA